MLTVAVKARKLVTEGEKNSPRVNPNYDLCEDIQCLAVEDIFNQTVDSSRAPCEDYVKYACHKNYSGSRDHDPFPQDPNQVLSDLMHILDRDVLDELDTGNYALEIERTIFQLCKNRGAFTADEKLHYERSVLPRTGANRLEREFDYPRGHLSDWSAVDLRYGLEGFGFAFFDVDIYQPADDPEERYILIKPPPNEIMKQSDLLSQRFNKRDGYRKSDRKYDKLSNFMMELLEIMPRGTSKRRGSDVAKLTVDDWTQKYEAHVSHKCAKIEWSNYLSKLFGKVREPVRDDTTLAVQNEAYFYALAGLLSRTNDVDVIADYAHLHFVSRSIGLVDPGYRTYSALPQIDGLSCTPGLLAGSLYKYADRYFPAESRLSVRPTRASPAPAPRALAHRRGSLSQLQVLAHKVRDAVVARLRRTVGALDAAPGPAGKLRRKLTGFVDKFAEASVHLGYPAWLTNATVAYRLYGTRKDRYSSASFYDNQALVVEQLLEEKLRTWKRPGMPIVDLRELGKGFQSSRIEVNAEGEEPEIVVPFGYFAENNYKLFSSQLFDPINYGAAGAEIAFNLYYALIDSILDADNSVAIGRCLRERVPDRVGDRDSFAKRAAAYLLALDTAYEALPSKHSYPIQFVDFGAMADTDVFFLSFAKVSASPRSTPLRFPIRGLHQPPSPQSLCSITPEVTSLPYAEERDQQRSYRIGDYHVLLRYIGFAFNNSIPFAENYLCTDQLRRLRKFECDPLIFDFAAL
ncbi:uncharacterized protein LOC131673194 isoform X2 [Phymastichus coffea]|uniref:uncharacterized protein LOC131673194 isoform X2 n=1 Tax=Phymastichus coffea TaxID=108790 RepID=UPI00273AD669|nr:uncharacterized protein LOC131673194 isoform X2 [Phymastichus coffea]